MICPTCSSGTLRPKNNNTQVRGHTHPASIADTTVPVVDGVPAYGFKSSQSRSVAPVAEAALRDILETFKQYTTKTIDPVISDVVTQMLRKITMLISECQDSLSFLNDQHQCLNQRQEESTKISDRLQIEN